MRNLIFCLALFTFISCFGQTNRTIKFSIDMNSIFPNLNDSTINVGLRGNVDPLSWVRSIKMQDSDKDGVYTTTVAFKKNDEKTVYFKYVLNDVEWESGDALSVKLKPDDYKSYESSFRYHEKTENPFKKFIGEWTLKDDLWLQGDSMTIIDTLYLPDHFSICKEINTGRSLLWIVDATSARGHSLWTFNKVTKEVFAQSSFYPDRIGLGSGTVNTKGDIQLKLTFKGNEPEGTYRKYSYEWVNDREYILKSYQYDHNNQPTGNFYGGTFIRIKNTNK